MKLSWFGRAAMALISALALGLSMTACGGGTIAYMWTVGQQYNQIAGFKVDDYTGNLTQIQHAPFSTEGSNPVSIVVRPGGRYVYVVNQGTASTSKGNSQDSGISVFAVGGDGTLAFEESYPTQGSVHLWAAFDSTGNYLFVLDKYSPRYQPDPTKPNYDPNGAITTFSSDQATGQLHVVSQTASTPSGGTAPLYLEVGSNPLIMASSGACLFTINQSDQSVTPYSIASGQLGTVTTGKFYPGTVSMTHINGNGQYMFITDSDNDADQGRIFPYTIAAGCALTTFTGGAQANDPTAHHPSYAFVDNSGKYVGVLNQSTQTTGATATYSSISMWYINNGQLQETGGPYKSGSGPMCAVEDPTNKYIYVSNFNDGTVTGYYFDPTHGTLADLSRGSQFNATGQLGCLAISGAVGF